MASEGNKPWDDDEPRTCIEGGPLTTEAASSASSDDLESMASKSQASLFRPSSTKSKVASDRVVKTNQSAMNVSITPTPTRKIEARLHSSQRLSRSQLEKKKGGKDGKVSTEREKQKRSIERQAAKVGGLEAERYYHGLMPRDDIETMLLKDGDFLVRKTDVGTTKRITVSVFFNGKRRHVLLRRTSKGEWQLGANRFPNVPQLIEYFRTNKIPVTPDGALLKKPVFRQKWQLHHENVRMEEKLGSGAFGEVFRGVLVLSDQPPVQVAVKTLHGKGASSKEQRTEFMAEAGIMRNLCHQNIVRVLGVIAQEDPLMILMELMPKGSLLSHLRKRGAQCPDSEHVRYCVEAARGMKYLESKDFLHRDVAARNCLLGPKEEVKITDFGLSTHTDRLSVDPDAKMPVKWLAPETLQHRRFNGKTDVWSFGILMWEVLSDGAEPYPGMSNSQVRSKILKDQYRMDPPQRTPNHLKPLFTQCWQQEPHKRPSFKQLYQHLKFGLTTSKLSAFFSK